MYLTAMFGRHAATLCRYPARSRLSWTLHTQKQSLQAAFWRNSVPARAYAVVGRPRKTVGEPSRPVKRGTAKKTSTTKKKPVKESKAKKKATAKKPAKPAKKALTAEQKEAAEKKKQKERITVLKQTALKPPTVSKLSAYTAFTKDKWSDRRVGAGLGISGVHSVFSQTQQEIANEWKNITPSELEHYNHVANSANASAQAEYKQWVESHAPETIVQANRARKVLRRLSLTKRGLEEKWPAIEDERQVKMKRPTNGWLRFFVARQHSGDFRHIRIAERAQLISQEWKALSASEKQKYVDQESQAWDRYRSEHRDVHGRVPASADTAAAAAAAAA